MKKNDGEFLVTRTPSATRLKADLDKLTHDVNVEMRKKDDRIDVLTDGVVDAMNFCTELLSPQIGTSTIRGQAGSLARVLQHDLVQLLADNIPGPCPNCERLPTVLANGWIRCERPGCSSLRYSRADWERYIKEMKPPEGEGHVQDLSHLIRPKERNAKKDSLDIRSMQKYCDRCGHYLVLPRGADNVHCVCGFVRFRSEVWGDLDNGYAPDDIERTMCTYKGALGDCHDLNCPVHASTVERCTEKGAREGCYDKTCSMHASCPMYEEDTSDAPFEVEVLAPKGSRHVPILRTVGSDYMTQKGNSDDKWIRVPLNGGTNEVVLWPNSNNVVTQEDFDDLHRDSEAHNAHSDQMAECIDELEERVSRYQKVVASALGSWQTRETIREILSTLTPVTHPSLDPEVWEKTFRDYPSLAVLLTEILGPPPPYRVAVAMTRDDTMESGARCTVHKTLNRARKVAKRRGGRYYVNWFDVQETPQYGEDLECSPEGLAAFNRLKFPQVEAVLHTGEARVDTVKVQADVSTKKPGCTCEGGVYNPKCNAGRNKHPSTKADVSSPEEMLVANNKRMRHAGNALATAALRVVDEYDGLHRLSLAIGEWTKALADEGGRGKRYKSKGPYHVPFPKCTKCGKNMQANVLGDGYPPLVYVCHACNEVQPVSKTDGIDWLMCAAVNNLYMHRAQADAEKLKAKEEVPVRTSTDRVYPLAGTDLCNYTSSGLRCYSVKDHEGPHQLGTTDGKNMSAAEEWDVPLSPTDEFATTIGTVVNDMEVYCSDHRIKLVKPSRWKTWITRLKDFDLRFQRYVEKRMVQAREEAEKLIPKPDCDCDGPPCYWESGKPVYCTPKDIREAQQAEEELLDIRSLEEDKD